AGSAETGGGNSGDDGSLGGAADSGNPEPTDGGTPSDGGGSQPEGGLVGGPGPASMSSFDWGKAVIDTEMAGKTSLGTSYPEGLMLHGIYKAYKRLKDPKYLTFLTNSADKYGTPGSGSLDGIMHMTALVDAYELTMKESYKAAADGTRRIFDK